MFRLVERCPWLQKLVIHSNSDLLDKSPLNPHCGYPLYGFLYPILNLNPCGLKWILYIFHFTPMNLKARPADVVSLFLTSFLISVYLSEMTPVGFLQTPRLISSIYAFSPTFLQLYLASLYPSRNYSVPNFCHHQIRRIQVFVALWNAPNTYYS